MKNRVLKSVAVLGTVTLAGLLLAACGSKSSNKDAAASNEITAYVDEGYKSYMEEVAKAYEKETGTKVTIKTGDALTGLDNLSLDNQSGKSPDVMMAPYDRVGSLGADGQLSEVELEKEAKTDNTTKSLVTIDGTTYGAPAVIETLVMYYNKDLIQKAPTTFAEVEELVSSTPDAPVACARLHGDLWAGNVLWDGSSQAQTGGALIDPMAHGGHAESDLAMLALFGYPYLDDVIAAYDELSPLADGWHERVGLHQLAPLLLHCVLFGGAYVAQTLGVARRYA